MPADVQIGTAATSSTMSTAISASDWSATAPTAASVARLATRLAANQRRQKVRYCSGQRPITIAEQTIAPTRNGAADSECARMYPSRSSAAYADRPAATTTAPARDADTTIRCLTSNAKTPASKAPAWSPDRGVSSSSVRILGPIPRGGGLTTAL
jgi:hypothetical protein